MKYSEKINYVVRKLDVKESSDGAQHLNGINISGRIEIMDVLVALVGKIDSLEARLDALEK